MPWRIRKKGNKFLVVSEASGRVLGAHKTRAEALAQLRAVYANAKPEEKRRRKR